MRRLVAVLVAGLVLPAAAAAHLERPTTFPDPSRGAVPVFRSGGPTLVVCKDDSRTRIAKLPVQLRRADLALLAQCGYRDIQAAVDGAANGTRIVVLPGVYRELPSRVFPNPDPRCAGLLIPAFPHPGSPLVAGYDYQLRCPNAQNLIALVGDTDGDGVCDAKCDIQIVGAGARPADVTIEGDPTKQNVIRADRADGFALRNVTLEVSDFNDVYVIETNGFRLQQLVTRWSKEYGILTFTSDHGLYDHVTAYGNGDAGIYPGAGPEGHCARYGIEIRFANSYGNLLGSSGTSGNGTWTHDSSFHDNALGLAVDSAFAGHPGMPQDCSKWTNNRIYANNRFVYDARRLAYCRRPYPERNPRVLCPTLLAPSGTGLFILGGNDNLVANNAIYDNWRAGVRLQFVPAFARGDDDPAHTYDTSHGNQIVNNRFRGNGVDVWWDGEGTRNCWSGQRTITSGPAKLPRCPGSATFAPPLQSAVNELAVCAGWHGQTSLPGCSWLTRPRRPRR